MTASLFDDSEIWPAFLRFPGAAGYTLWGNGGEEDDIVLSEGGKILLFPDPLALTSFIVADQASNFADLPGYAEVRKACAGLPGKVWKQSAVHYQVDHALELLHDGPEGWDMGTVALVGDVLSMLWDIACTLDDTEALALLKTPAPLGRLSDLLGFATRAGLGEQLQRVDWQAVALDGEVVVGRLKGACSVRS